MNDVQISFSAVLGFFGAITVIAGGVKIIIQLLSPFKKLSTRLDECEERLNKHDTLFANDKEAIDNLKRNDKNNTKTFIILLNHFIDGNGIDKIKEIREEIQNRIF